ncbi:MAG TPA: urease accessory protein UreD [Acidimicrobiales bacterium]
MSQCSAASLRLGRGDGGIPIVEQLRCSGALYFRPTEWGVWMVGAGAHPIGGDRLSVRLTVAAGCNAEVRSTSATLARKGPGPGCERSAMVINVRIGREATLMWNPEPGVAAAGSDHVADTRIRMGDGARLAWRDEFVIGRHGEEPGTWRSRLRIAGAGSVLLSSDTAAGPRAPGWRSSAVLDGARAISTLVVIDPLRKFGAATQESRGTTRALALPLAAQGVQVVAWGQELSDCREAVESLACRVRATS